MEVHVELKTISKMFCNCKNDLNETKANKNICEICMAEPGTLPTVNKQAIDWTVLIAKALNCKIAKKSKFDRKHYFYPDLPKGYQISQLDQPIGEKGFIELDFPLENTLRSNAKINITRVHLEEDTAKLTHDLENNTLIDFNRAGTPLVEIVSDPDFKSAIEAKTYLQELRTILRYLAVSDADMEKGHMRCEANISVQETGKFEIVDGIVKALGDYKLNNKVELKNLNSFKAVEKGINFEIKRQTELLEKGESWIQQTRGWNDKKNETYLQREKENSADYRYFPEPDIPPFNPEKFFKSKMPELPINKRKRFIEEYKFSYSDAKILTDKKNWADFTEKIMTELYDWLETEKSQEDISLHREKIARLTGPWLTTKLLGIMTEKNLKLKDIKFSSENFAELISLMYTEKINPSNALKVLNEMLEKNSDIDPSHIMEEKGYGQIKDENKLGTIIEETIRSFPKQVEEYKAGKEAILKFLIGMVMKSSEGSADPGVVEKLLKEKLK